MTNQLRDARSLPRQLADALRSRIIAGEWAPGEQMPSEQALADEVGVSRPTVRAALRLLMGSGLVRVRQGSGTFVTSHGSGVVAGLQDLRSMSAIISEQRANSTVVYRKREQREATAEEAARFDETPPFRVVDIERSFMSDDNVIAFEWSMINAALLPEDFTADNLSESVFAALEPLGLLPDQAIATVRPVNDDSIAWEGTRTASSLYLCLTQQTYKDDGRIVTWSQTYFTENNFEFSLIRTR